MSVVSFPTPRPPSTTVGCELVEYLPVIINADHLSAVRKWTAEESKNEEASRWGNTRGGSNLKL